MPAAGGTTRGGKAKPNPRDYTGVVKARLEAEVADEQAERAEEVTLMAQTAARRRATEVVDYTEGGHAAPVQVQPGPQRGVISDALAAQIEEIDGEVEVGPKKVRIRVNSPIEDMTYGRQVLKEAVLDERGYLVEPPQLGNLQFYSFEEGVTYLVPLELAIHLDELGYVYH